MLTLPYIVLVFFLVFANGFFVASEFASRIELLATNGSKGARRLLVLLESFQCQYFRPATSHYDGMEAYYRVLQWR